MIQPVALLALGISVAYLVTPSAARLAWRVGAVDHPSPSKLHSRDVARCGGISVFLTLIITLALIGSLADEKASQYLTSLALAALCIFMLGMVDDVKGLGPWPKLTMQTLAASIIFASGPHAGAFVPGWDLPIVLDYASTVLWFLILVNGFNLIDGLDGLAAGTSAVCGLGLGLLFLSQGADIEAAISLAFAGAMLGFLPYNLAPAKVFLGDTGSMLAGFTLATLTLGGARHGGGFESLLLPLLILSFPILDTFLCCWRRGAKIALAYLSEEPRPPGIMCRDLEHVHHRVLAREGSHRQATFKILLVISLLTATAVVCVHANGHGPLIFALSVATLTAFVIGSVASIEVRLTRELLSLMLRHAAGGASRKTPAQAQPGQAVWWLSDNNERMLICGSDTDRSIIMRSSGLSDDAGTRIPSPVPDPLNGYDAVSLSSILSVYPISTIVVTSSINLQATESILQIANAYSVPVVRWTNERSSFDRSDVGYVPAEDKPLLSGAGN